MCIDILNVLYNQVMNVSPDRVDDSDLDHYIQSKGYSVEALYTVLAETYYADWQEAVERVVRPGRSGR